MKLSLKLTSELARSWQYLELASELYLELLS
jgi:hypothetical protein